MNTFVESGTVYVLRVLDRDSSESAIKSGNSSVTVQSLLCLTFYPVLTNTRSAVCGQTSLI
jgi:hypothetical protein